MSDLARKAITKDPLLLRASVKTAIELAGEKKVFRTKSGISLTDYEARVYTVLNATFMAIDILFNDIKHVDDSKTNLKRYRKLFAAELDKEIEGSDIASLFEKVPEQASSICEAIYDNLMTIVKSPVEYQLLYKKLIRALVDKNNVVGYQIASLLDKLDEDGQPIKK